MPEKESQTSELRPILDKIHTAELAHKIDEVLDHRYDPGPRPKKPSFWQQLIAFWSK